MSMSQLILINFNTHKDLYAHIEQEDIQLLAVYPILAASFFIL